MKKVILAVAVVLLGAGLSMANSEAANDTSTMQLAEAADGMMKAANTVNGTVSTVSLGDSSKGMQASVSLLDDKGKQEKIMVPQDAKIWDANSQAITFSQIKSNSKIKVDYKMTSNGEKEATAIHLQS